MGLIVVVRTYVLTDLDERGVVHHEVCVGKLEHKSLEDQCVVVVFLIPVIRAKIAPSTKHEFTQTR